MRHRQSSAILILAGIVTACSGQVRDTGKQLESGSGSARGTDAGSAGHGPGAGGHGASGAGGHAPGVGGDGLGTGADGPGAGGHGPAGAGGSANDGGARDTGSSGTAGVAGVDAGAVADGGPSCGALIASVENTVAAAFANAARDCTQDDDCVYAPRTSCASPCGTGPVSKDDVASFQAAVDRSEPSCRQFTALGCMPLAVACVAVPGGPACENGTCQIFLLEKWSTFTVTSSPSSYMAAETCAGASDGSSDCTSRTFTPDGLVTKTTGGVTTGGRLSSADFTELDGIIRSVSLRQGFDFPGFNCPVAVVPPAPHIIFKRSDARNTYATRDLSGCLTASNPTSDPARIWTIAERY